LIRTQVSLDKKEYALARREAQALGISVAEFVRRALRRYDQRRAIQLLNFIHELPNLKTLAFDTKDLVKAGLVIKKFSDQPLTLADAHSLAIMTAHRIKTCGSTDRHLGLTGATLVN
jgi:predicted nucleic acid-binding protein